MDQSRTSESENVMTVRNCIVPHVLFSIMQNVVTVIVSKYYCMQIQYERRNAFLERRLLLSLFPLPLFLLKGRHAREGRLLGQGRTVGRGEEGRGRGERGACTIRRGNAFFVQVLSGRRNLLEATDNQRILLPSPVSPAYFPPLQP